MSFQQKNMSVLACVNGFTLWYFTSQDTIEEILNPNYFSAFATLVNIGDIVMLNCANVNGFRRIAEIKGNQVILAELQ